MNGDERRYTGILEFSSRLTSQLWNVIYPGRRGLLTSKHLLWALMSLKAHSIEAFCGMALGVDPKTLESDPGCLLRIPGSICLVQNVLSIFKELCALYYCSLLLMQDLLCYSLGGAIECVVQTSTLDPSQLMRWIVQVRNHAHLSQFGLSANLEDLPFGMSLPLVLMLKMLSY